MTNDELSIVALALGAVSSSLREYERQRSQGTNPNAELVIGTITREASRIEVNGPAELASGLRTLRENIEAMANG